ncbi:Uncharacterised protein [[Eubacterium] contortum]|uniref:Uncharacterized protein n=2 Tax=Bacillota TaxID=1239 RepID=A0A174F0Y4_9FIRM|nr:transposase domain-containing protein [Faecalicatena contorta]CUO41970.1 Uncharacterised protein [[Eubacterium] contortum] [Faecalicatena contorta]
MKEEFLQGRYAHGDATRVQVIDEPDTIRGAQASATLYSITETALMNGLKPYNYLSHVMEKMKDFGAFSVKEEMVDILPWSAKLSDDYLLTCIGKSRFWAFVLFRKTGNIIPIALLLFR